MLQNKSKMKKIGITCNRVMFTQTMKDSEGIIPNESEDYRPPAELYPYLTNVAELYEGEKPPQSHAVAVTSVFTPSVTVQTTGGASTLSASCRQTTIIPQWATSRSSSLCPINSWYHRTAMAARLWPFTWTRPSRTCPCPHRYARPYMDGNILKWNNLKFTFKIHFTDKYQKSS